MTARRPFTIHKTAAYRMIELHYGCEITRERDGASVFFQGDDASYVRAELDAIDNIADHWTEAQYDGAFNLLCSNYDEVMSLAKEVSHA